MILLEYGLDTAKFFPCVQFGGLNAIKALAGPFPGMRFIPTGGVSEKNMREFLSFDKIIACGGSWMVKSELIDAGRFEDIRALTARAVELARGFAHG
jgi:2-dehydro-3-deoxyphosphogluconate aldolase/(4S)-4-hydroxy-2-oxoglutarate aldolase